MTIPFETQGSTRPIGYWIRSADRCLTKAIEAIQSDLGLERADWQVLNTLAESAAGMPFGRLRETFDSMLEVRDLHMVLISLADRRLVWFEEDFWQLTDKGRDVHRSAMERQTALRRSAMQGISEADYSLVVNVLARLVSNCHRPEDT